MGNSTRDTPKELQDALTASDVVAVKSEQQRVEEALLDTLAELGGQRVSDDDLIFRGRQLVIPETMTARDAITYLNDHIEQQEEETRFDRIFRFRPWDGAHALQNALRKVFGTAGIGKPTYTFFGKNPPAMRSINIGVGETTQVPWGELAVPLFKGTMYLTATEDEELGQLFHLVVDAPRKYRKHVEGLFGVVQRELEENSIYRSKAIDGQDNAEYLPLDGVNPDKVIYSDEVVGQLNANVWSLLEHTDTMRKLNMPLKRSVLLEGPYGTGKTLAAFLTAKVAVENGWSFIYCRPGKDSLDSVMATARLYQPSVVFFEDVDILAENGERDNVTRLLDLFDGITSKGTEIICILTTNHKERIHKGMVRPGRLDAMIHIGSLDQSGCQRMIEAVVSENMRGDLNYEAIFASMEGFFPAFVKEAIDRTVRYAIARQAHESPDTPIALDRLILVTEDFVQAAEGLRPQLDMLDGANEGKTPDTLTTATRGIVREVLDETKVHLPSVGETDGRLKQPVENGALATRVK